MTIGVGSLIEVSLEMLMQGQQTMNVYQYEVVSWPGSVTPVQAAEGWWNHVKADYRAMCWTGYGSPFRAVRILELNNPSGDYATFDVPTAEQPGTRVVAGSPEMSPPFCAAGIQLTVGSRVTRPGQKRFPFLLENDMANGALTVVFTPLANALATTIVTSMVLGAPAALVDLLPIVTRKDASGAVIAHQPVGGYLLNPNVTTQNSRKFGRGA